MKIIKGTEVSETHWTARKLIEMMKDGDVNFNIDIQRGYVWKNNDRKSALISTMILNKAIPPLYFNKVDDVYEGSDGKQRALTVMKFLNDEFKLSGLQPFQVINDDGEPEEIDINGLKFSELLECFQNAIREYNFMICFTTDADAEEVADTFYNLNNGQSLNAATMNRVKAKSKTQIARLGKHKVFKDALSNVALEGHTNEDLAVKAHAILNDDNVCMNATWVRKYMKNVEITEQDEIMLNKIFDRIYNIHRQIEDKKIAKRIYTRTHMISIIPMIKKSIDDEMTDIDVMKWFVEFFAGKRSASISDTYNRASSTGSGKNESVKTRLDELQKSYYKYFNIALAS